MKSPKDVLALGQVIVRQLELHDRGTVLSRWIAHHLAEVISNASRAVGSAKEVSEAQAVDLVLKLWAHRRTLPASVDPLGGYRKAAEFLDRLAPEANPWPLHRQRGTYDDLLYEMFELLGKIVIAGILLTQVSRTRAVAKEEFMALEEEERYWHSTLERWMPFVTNSLSQPEIKIERVNTDTAKGGELDREVERPCASGNQGRTKEGVVTSDDTDFHANIASNLERMLANLANLLARWQESSLRTVESEGEDFGDSVVGHAATTDGSLDISGSPEITSEKIESETAVKEAVPSDRDHSFWLSLSLIELAEAQNIVPVDDLENIAALWPSDDGPDELFDHIIRERADRRRVATNGSDQ